MSEDLMGNVVDIDSGVRRKLKTGAVLNPNTPTPNIQDNCCAEALSHEDIFTPEECAKVIALVPEFEKARVAKSIQDGKNTGIQDEIRNNSNHILIPTEDNAWVFEKVLAIVMAANNSFFRFDIDHFNAMQISKYEVGEYYHAHLDIGAGVNGNRKISVTVQLSEEDSYEGGDLYMDFTDFTAPRKIGSVTLFPSFLKHQIKAVTKGTRYSLVAWISGTNRFR